MKKILIFALIFLIGALLLFLYFYNALEKQKEIKPVANLEQTLGQSPTESPLSIDSLRERKIENTQLTIEKDAGNGTNYKKYIASYKSEDYKIYGLLTIPNGEVPKEGFSAIIFNHGYIPPQTYKTEEKYVAYVDYLAKSGFVVFKIDMRGHGQSEGNASGTYFSPAYTIDVLSALKALQSDSRINKQKIGLWGHSMSGNLVLRSMLVSSEFKAGVIWAGAVYSYKDFAKYGIADNSYVKREHINENTLDSNDELTKKEIAAFRDNKNSINFETEFWKSISLTQNLKYLNSPIQIHHAKNDNVVNIGYSRDLKMESDKLGKNIELIEYNGGGHNIDSPYFEQAMQKTVEYFKKYL